MKVKLKEVCEILFSLPIKNRIPNLKKGLLLTQADLKDDNITCVNESDIDFDENTCISAQINDVLIKRNNPTYVNVYNENQKVFLGLNIVVFRAKDIYPLYLAYVLEQNLQKLNALTNRTTVLQVLNRQMLEDLEINIIEKNKQVSIGKVWYLHKKENQLLEKLLQKEKQKQKILEQTLYNNLGEE